MTVERKYILGPYIVSTGQVECMLRAEDKLLASLNNQFTF